MSRFGSLAAVLPGSHFEHPAGLFFVMLQVRSIEVLTCQGEEKGADSLTLFLPPRKGMELTVYSAPGV